jgi:uncharacterized protein YndB with AHSA1/START domain
VTDRIDREMVILAPLQEVWRVIAGNGWLAEEVQLDLVPGGEARFVTGGGIRTGWVEDARSPDEDEAGAGAHLVFWWSADGEPASRVELTLDPEGDGATRLRLTETRPLEVLDLVGIPLPGAGGGLPGAGGGSYGPAMLVAA